MKIKENYVMREVAGQAIVIALGEESERFKGMINLNKTGKDVWLCLQKGMDVTEIAKKLVEKYEVAEEIVMRDVESMMDRLARVGVLGK